MKTFFISFFNPRLLTFWSPYKPTHVSYWYSLDELQAILEFNLFSCSVLIIIVAVVFSAISVISRTLASFLLYSPARHNKTSLSLLTPNVRPSLSSNQPPSGCYGNKRRKLWPNYASCPLLLSFLLLLIRGIIRFMDFPLLAPTQKSLTAQLLFNISKNINLKNHYLKE